MRDKDKFLQVRMTEEERELLKQIASDYGLDVSAFVRSAVVYFDQKRPDLVIVSQGKEVALTAMG